MSWIPQSLRTYDGEPVTPTDAARPEVRASLMRRQRNTLVAASVSVPPTVLILAAILWPHTSHRGLTIWALVASANTVAHWWLHLRLPLERVSVTRLFVAHAIGGFCWASLPLLAMPVEPEWQAMVGACMIAVLAAGLVFASQFALPFAAWVISLSASSLTGFLLLDSTLGNALAILAALAAAYSLVLGAVLRAGDLGASVFAARNADLVQELQVEQQLLRELALTDTLTGIGNRLAFSQDLSEAIQDGTTSVSMALIDLDGFKRINDSLGHHAGDQVLRGVSNRIQAALKPGERLYRLGGDELTVIQRRTPGTTALTELGQRLSAVFDEPIRAAGRPREIKASIGIAESSGSTDNEALQSDADEALYHAKRSPEFSVSYFDRAMQIESARQKALLADATRALDAGEIVPWLQPMVELSTGAVVGAEALARWEHPNGVRNAGAFVPALEESGNAARLDGIVFDAVCDYRRRLAAIHGDTFSITFNVSPVFLQVFLDRHGKMDRLLDSIIEITEQRDLTNHDDLSRLIKRAQDAGAKVLVDDFGTGFSTMERLSLGSFDGLKIDGSFVEALTYSRNSMAIVASIAEIGRQLDIPVVAEGVESAEQAAQLSDYGIRWAQGYHYSPAIPVAEMAEILEHQRSHGPYFSRLAATSVSQAVNAS